MRRVDDQRLAGRAERLEHRRGRLGFLVAARLELVDDDERAVGQLRRQRRAQRAQLHLARQRVVVAARLRPEHGAALAPQRVADFADAGAAGALLPPRLLARAADVGAVLRRVRALVLLRVLVHDRFPDQVGLDHAAEELVLEIDRADVFFVAVNYIYLHVSVPASSNRFLFRLPASSSLSQQPAGRRQLATGSCYFLPLAAGFFATVTLPAFSTWTTGSFFAATALRTTM